MNDQKVTIREIFSILDIPYNQDTERAFKSAFDFLLMCEIGDTVKASQGNFKRVSSKVFTVDQQASRDITIPKVIELVL